jgi:hypothetical protein
VACPQSGLPAAIIYHFGHPTLYTNTLIRLIVECTFALGLAVAVGGVEFALAVDGRELALLALPRPYGFVAVERVFHEQYVAPLALDARAFVATRVRTNSRLFNFLGNEI